LLDKSPWRHWYAIGKFKNRETDELTYFIYCSYGTIEIEYEYALNSLCAEFAHDPHPNKHIRVPIVSNQEDGESCGHWVVTLAFYMATQNWNGIKRVFTTHLSHSELGAVFSKIALL
jgi:hypothetical protein